LRAEGESSPRAGTPEVDMSPVLLLLAICVQSPSPASVPSPAPRCSWIENRGQWDTPARFVGEFGDARVRIEPRAIWLHTAAERGGRESVLLKLSFEGASDTVSVEGLRPTPTLHSYFLGNDPTKWISAVPSYEQVRLVGLYPGIDVVLGTRAGKLKYDIRVAPHADLSRFVVRCEGADALCLDQDLAVRIETRAEPMAHALGDAWEERPDGTTRAVHPRWRLVDAQRLAIDLDDRDSLAALVIDPELSWATYLGTIGNLDVPNAAVAAADGTVVVVGSAGDLSFPTTPGSVLLAPPGGANLFVTRLSADGCSLLYSCMIGGSPGMTGAGEQATSVCLDDGGRAYVTGFTTASDFPTTPGAFDRQFDGGGDCFALRLSSQGDVLEYSTFLGGSEGDLGYACTAAASGALVIVGETASSDFPTSPNAVQQVFKGSADVFVSRLGPDGSSLEWSTFLGGFSAERALGVDLADDEDVVLTGRTNSTNFPTTPGSFESVWQGSTFDDKAFVTRLDASGAFLVWSSFLGGPTFESTEGTIGYAIRIIPSGDVFVAGSTHERTFPTTPGVFQPAINHDPLLGFHRDGFLTRFDELGATLLFSTYFGAEYGEWVLGLEVDASGMATLGSYCVFLPTTPGSFQPVPPGNLNLGVSRFDPRGERLVYSSLVGGPFEESTTALAVTPEGRATVVGYTTGGFPVTPGSFDPTYNGGQLDGVVATLDLLPTGVDSLGASTPSCHGPLILQPSEMPQAGSTTFSLLCSNAPPNAPGWLLLGRKLLPQPVPFGGASLWIAPPHRLLRFPVLSDSDGFVDRPISLAGVPAGARLAAQFVFRNTAQCSGQGIACASQALAIVVQ
jgi:hypothetical protein